MSNLAVFDYPTMYPTPLTTDHIPTEPVTTVHKEAEIGTLKQLDMKQCPLEILKVIHHVCTRTAHIYFFPGTTFLWEYDQNVQFLG